MFKKILRCKILTSQKMGPYVICAPDKNFRKTFCVFNYVCYLILAHRKMYVCANLRM